MASETSESADRPAPSRRRADRRRSRATGPRAVVVTAVAATLLLGTGLATTAYVKAQGRGTGSAAPAASASSTQAVANAVAAMATTKPLVDWDDVLDKALAGVTKSSAAKYSVAVLDTGSGDSAVYGSGSFDTASIVKVDILATLLLQAQDAGRALTDSEKAAAKVMIENSDNTAASTLWQTIGTASGLDTANRRFGLTGTSGGSGVLWGLTQTTAADQLRLLEVVFGRAPGLNAASRSYIQGLMGQVSTYQDWGCRARPPGTSRSRTAGCRGARPPCGTSTASAG